MINTIKDKKEKINGKLGIILCAIITIFFMCTYIWVNYHRKSMDITAIPVINADNEKFLHIEEVNSDDNGTLYVTAIATNSDIKYDYFNWVLGEGNAVYKKMSILLVSNDGQTAYKLKTYPYAFKSKDNSISEEFSSYNGILAYGDVGMLEDGSKKVAVLFEDREGNSHILFPKEDYYIDEN